RTLCRSSSLALVSFVSFVSFSQILVVDPAELPQQLLRSLVEHPRQHECHFDHEIATTAVARRPDAALAPPEPLTALGAGRPALRTSIWPPPHVRQCICRCRPEPPHCAHGFENTMWPRADLTTPEPWQCWQRISATFRRPRPPHAWQCSCRVTATDRWPPRAASSKLSV